MCHSMGVEVRGQLEGGQFCPSTRWVLRIKLRSSDLEESTLPPEPHHSLMRFFLIQMWAQGCVQFVTSHQVDTYHICILYQDIISE